MYHISSNTGTEFQLSVMFYIYIYSPPHSEYKELRLHATKSLKCDNINKFCLLVSDNSMY